MDADRLAVVEDADQNMWRWAGDLTHAAKVTQKWDSRTGHHTMLPAIRLGEILYLQGRYNDASAAFESALRRAQDGYVISFATAQARLDRGAALLGADRTTEGIEVLRQLSVDTDQAEAEFRLGTYKDKDAKAAYRYAVVAYQTRLQLGDAERRSGQQPAALEDYTAAADRLPLTGFDTQVVPGVLYNNEALALMAADRVKEARVAAERAVATDRANPIFLLTAASAAQQAGDLEQATAQNAKVISLDPTAFPAANNLGVDLAAAGKLNEATTALRQAVGSRPDYAIGWFNLGVLYSKRGPVYLLPSQGALARAAALDPELANAHPGLIVDEHVYRTGL